MIYLSHLLKVGDQKHADLIVVQEALRLFQSPESSMALEAGSKSTLSWVWETCYDPQPLR